MIRVSGSWSRRKDPLSPLWTTSYGKNRKFDRRDTDNVTMVQRETISFYTVDALASKNKIK